jgi:hypothetical protein
MMTDQQRFRVAERSGRRPKTVEKRRVCAASDCETILSRYNLRETCRVHTELRFPSVRGKT